MDAAGSEAEGLHQEVVSGRDVPGVRTGMTRSKVSMGFFLFAGQRLDFSRLHFSRRAQSPATSGNRRPVRTPGHIGFLFLSSAFV